jgi:hypothetical protein
VDFGAGGQNGHTMKMNKNKKIKLNSVFQIQKFGTRAKTPFWGFFFLITKRKTKIKRRVDKKK